MINKTIAHYKILEKIGEGGMGVVYKAEDTKLIRMVALKFLPPELTRDAQAKARFVQEAQAAAALDHPNICAVHEIGEAEGATYIVMPHIKGQSLKERIAAGPISVEEALAIASQVAEGLKEAHERGIIHRDIKPANIMLTEKGQAKIMDFGLAKLEAGVDLTRTMAVIGTAAYMSPEQARGEEVDHRTDIWSFGATLYEMLTRQKPFGHKHDQALLYSILNDTSETVSRIRPEIPNYLDRLIQKALEKDRSRRYQNMAELLKDLKSTGLSGLSVPKVDKSIIVLPFEDISPGKDNEYFCDGMTEEIITDLSHVHDLLVISRSSAMTLKGTKKTIPEIAGAVNVRYVLEGSVRKAGNDLRIVAQLIDAANDTLLWAEKFAGTLIDVFDIQEKLSRRIVEALKLKLSPDANRKIAARPIENVHAYESYLRARQEILRFTEAGLEQAQKMLQNGLEIAGENALLYAGMGFFSWQQINLGYKAHEFESLLRQTEDCAQKALQLDAHSGYGYFLLGLVENKRGNEQQAVRLLERALEIEPDNPDVLYWLALFLSVVGKGASARALVKRLLAVDPLTAFHHFLPGWLDYTEGKLEEGLERCRSASEKDPSGVSGWVLAILLLGNRRLEEAGSLIGLLERRAFATPYIQSLLFVKLAMSTRKSEAVKCVTKELEAAAQQDEVLPWLMASGYALLDENEDALRWLEIAVSRGFINFPFLSQYDPFMQNLRGDKCFEKLMVRVKYDWEHFEV